MASVTVDVTALADPRFTILGGMLGAPSETAQAVGLYHAMRVWSYCTEKCVYRVDPAILDALQPGLANALLASRLGCTSRTSIRIKGTKGRVEWLNKLRENNRIRKQRSRSGHAAVTRDNPGPLTLTPTLTPTKELKTNTTCAPRTRVVVDPAGFAEAWKAYPHYETRSSRKASAQVWSKLGLSPHASGVLAWISKASASDDWTRENGRFVPGMQVWLKTVDAANPPVVETDRGRPREIVNRMLTEEEKAARQAAREARL